MKFYSLKKILAKQCQYNIIFGERSNGKSYACLDLILKRYSETGKQGAIIRRNQEDFRGKRGQSIFSPLIDNGIVSKYTHGEWTGIYYYSQRWYLCRKDDDSDRIIKQDNPFCYGFALTEQEHDKSTSYPDVTTVVFDEFITRLGYLQDEFVLFMNVLSTIIRYRDDVQIFMLGNTVNKYCPYFAEMGLDHVRNMRQGDIDVYKYGNSSLRVAVEYCGTNSRRNKPSDVYFTFNNPKLQMITGGAWEIGIYPHKPVDFRPKDIKFIYFIRFNESLLQCEIVMFDKYNFTFIHPKTTPLQSPDKDLIFDTVASPLVTTNRKLGESQGLDAIMRKIISYYMSEKVFFSDNTTGEVLRNYMEWCNRAKITD